MQRRADGVPRRSRVAHRPVSMLLAIVVVVVVVVLFAGGCTGHGGSRSVTSHPTSSGVGTSSLRTIPQPPLDKLSKLTRDRLASDAARVDLVLPSFSDPTKVTNPLFPIGALDAVILGEVDGEPLRIETTLLPETKTVQWGDQRVEALQSQFCAYLTGRIAEVAVDLYAQADDGSVWYLGEDVVDYDNGVAVTTEGTWQVGLDGPAALIMPAHPKVGDVYRTENVPGVAFEQVTIRKVGVTVDGPSGPIKGAVVGEELHQDETALEPKTFAPGHGEWFSGGDHNFEANALAVPADALQTPTPAELTTLSSGADQLLGATRPTDWTATSVTVHRLTNAWSSFRLGEVPQRLGRRMGQALDTLAAAVDARDSRRTSQAALDVANASLDLQLRYRPPVEINRARFQLWTRQLVVDATAKDPHAMRGDVTTLAWIRDRIALDPAEGNRIDDELRHLRAVADAQEFRVATARATRLGERLGGHQPTP